MQSYLPNPCRFVDCWLRRSPGWTGCSVEFWLRRISLATSADSSEGAGTLPRPDLNPLLNPLLAENMGRWAEVYFTSAPEKREEAVLELLRELEARKSENIPPQSEAAPCPQPMPVGTVDAGLAITCANEAAKPPRRSKRR